MKMPLQRRLILGLVAIVAGGSIAVTAGFAIHLRSESHRLSVEAELTDFFHLPCEVGQILGSTFSSRRFENVVIHLPDRRDQVFTCTNATWHEDAVDGRYVNRLEMHGGSLMLGSEHWERGDYRTVLESGLGHDFAELNLSRVDIADFLVVFRQAGFSLQCAGVEGVVDLQAGEHGVARLRAYRLNNAAVEEGVSIAARFDIRNGLNVTDVALDLPTVPLASIGLDAMLGTASPKGRFSGEVRYLRPASEEPPEVRVSGKLTDVQLSELTQRVPFGPFEGQASVDVDEARISNSLVTHLRGGGSIRNLSLSAFAGMLNIEKLSGKASLSVEPVQIALGQIHRLRMEGRVDGVMLDEFLGVIARGNATGRLTIRVHNFDIEENAIKAADIEVVAVPPPGRPGTIDRGLILSAAQQFLDFTWPESLPQSILPEKLEYVQFGARLLIRDNQLRILGTHGPSGDVILTIRVFGQDFGVVKQRPGAIDLTPAINAILERVRTYDPHRVRELIRR
ncbi:MAG: hypothetical protein KF841_02770 [Phycisphaerae bacterium]|nr:hypothetical protein [Phycisphaerae bacterium]